LLDIKLIREDPEVVRANLERRGDIENLQMLEDLIEYDRQWRRFLNQSNELRHERREATNKIASMKKSGQKFERFIDKGRKLDARISKIQEQVKMYRQMTLNILMKLPNLLHDSVPSGKGENDNIIVKEWGKPPKFDFKPKNHLEIARDLGIIDDERGGKIAGHGFLYLKGDLALLDLALQRFAIDFMMKKKYQLIGPPYMMRRKPYEGVTDLADFENVMYKVEGEDLYMIATAEHPLAAMFMNEILVESQLPIKMVGISPCFRKEVGTHGKYTKGLYRMHQFNKVEQFVFCRPENSWAIHEEVQRNAEELYQTLDLNYKVVNVCTGDIGSLAAKRYDIIIWMADGEYREIGSNSNCTDYQARRLKIKYREKEGQPPKDFIHTVNNTAIATSRTMLAILEQYQQKDGTVILPKALTKYLGGLNKLEPH